MAVEGTIMYYGGAFPVLLGLGFFLLLGAIAYMFWQIARTSRVEADIDETLGAFEILSIKSHAKKKGIDIDKELARQDFFSGMKKKRTFRREVQREILESMFGKEESKK